MATLSTDAPITPLRQRMQQDMLMRGLGPHTQQDYVRQVRRFVAFLGRAPDTAKTENIRRFQLHQHESGVGPATINGAVSALRFLFTVTLKRRDLARALVITRCPRKLPDVLSVEEAARLLEAAPGIKYKAALGVAYGAGLRVSEVAHLKVDDIDSTRMLIRVEQGRDAGTATRSIDARRLRFEPAMRFSGSGTLGGGQMIRGGSGRCAGLSCLSSTN
ncbi:phage integrase N-terminal SAM-like domain-containing protein [Mesorhizobium sp. B2-5-4]|uniref:tyrosine-type recombinase/integrase n=1 Tax=Mesorhizobium sp. B2-5-4 TaxID=2589926 RepID=UPI001FEDD302|nr:phage integrase N-terminal SAM-like domain-containing protein [Mesorhizobium sp. B2-5-4]